MGDLKNKKPQMIIQKTGCQGKMAFKWPMGMVLRFGTRIVMRTPATYVNSSHTHFGIMIPGATKLNTS